MKISILDCDKNRKTIFVKNFTFLFGLDVLIYCDEYNNSCILPLSDIYSISY